MNSRASLLHIALLEMLRVAKAQQAQLSEYALGDPGGSIEALEALSDVYVGNLAIVDVIREKYKETVVLIYKPILDKAETVFGKYLNG